MREFEPNGLPGYTVSQERDQRGALVWAVYAPGVKPGVTRSPTGKYILSSDCCSFTARRSAKGAVAAAHEHARWARTQEGAAAESARRARLFAEYDIPREG
jgi:hypothetical protein